MRLSAMEGWTMADPTQDAGTVQALLDRLVKVLLPQTLEIKERIDAGQRLSDVDLGFLKRMLEEIQQGQSVIARHPELYALESRLVTLYEDVVRKAVENEDGG
jgi:hypothetical protein